MSRGSSPVAAPLLVALIVASACAGETREEVVTAEDRGAALFVDPTLGRDGNTVTCADCHDEGGAPGATGKPGAPLGRVVDRPSYWGGQEDDLLDAVNQCLFWFMGRIEPMRRDDPDGADLFAHLATLDGGEEAAAPQPFTVGAVAWPGAGDAGQGAAVYERACAACHGAVGDGAGKGVAAAPTLPGETLAAHPPGDYTDEDRRLVFVEKVRHGPFFGYGGTMPPFSLEVLSDQALADLMAFMGVP